MECGLRDQGRSLLSNPNASVEPLIEKLGQAGQLQGPDCCPLVSLLQGWRGTSLLHSDPNRDRTSFWSTICPTPPCRQGWRERVTQCLGPRIRHSAWSSQVFTWVLFFFSLLPFLWITFYLIRFPLKTQYIAALLRRNWGRVSPLGPKWKVLKFT